MKKICAILSISLLMTSGMASDLAGSFKEAAALAEERGKDRATRIYSAIDLHDYYEPKYGPIFDSCVRSTDHSDISSFEFIVAIGKDGRVLQIWVDHETKIFACVRLTLQQDKFPAPPIAPYYMHVTMTFVK